jgi:hypothetical protein
MTHGNLIKGLFLVALAFAFGIGSLRYPMGNLGRAGPGMFPLLVSCLLGLIGVAIVTRSFFSDRVRLEVNLKNIGIIIASLAGFALLSEHLNMIVGIVFLVFCSTLAGQKYSMVRNLKVAAGLILVALAFQKLLGLQLPLY